MDDEKYERRYHEFYCPICRAMITHDFFQREYEKNSFDYVIIECERQEAYRSFMIEHFKEIHGVDFPERAKND